MASRLLHPVHAEGPSSPLHSVDLAVPTLTQLETLFVDRDFATVLLGCYRLLWRLCTAGAVPSPTPPLRYDGDARLQIDSLPPRVHLCAHPDCQCAALVALLTQALFELQRADEVLPLVLRLYPSGAAPFPVTRLTAQLLVHRNKLHDAAAFLTAALDAPSLSQAERAALLRLYVVRVAGPLQGRERALALAAAYDFTTADDVRDMATALVADTPPTPIAPIKAAAAHPPRATPAPPAANARATTPPPVPTAPAPPRVPFAVAVGLPPFVLAVLLWRWPALRRRLYAWLVAPVVSLVRMIAL